MTMDFVAQRVYDGKELYGRDVLLELRGEVYLLFRGSLIVVTRWVRRWTCRGREEILLP